MDVFIPDNVTNIGSGAFSYCKSLTNIVVSENNNSYSSEDGVLFNKDKSSLLLHPAGKSDTSYVVPDSVMRIGGSAFDGCSNLTSVTIPNSITSIQSYAFYGCSGLKSVTIPSGVTKVPEGCFLYCTSLEDIIIPNSVTKIAKSAFENCTSLGNIIIPDSVTEIGDCAFCDCTSLEKIVVPNSVNIIDTWAFQNCTSLKNVTISQGVTAINPWAFQNCISITNVEIPDSITFIGTGAFAGCYSLTDIEVSADNSAYSVDDGVLFNKDKTSLISYLAGKTNTSYIIPDTVTSIGNWAFYGCSTLKNITIGERVTSIGNNAFSGCDSITSINIPDSVTNIGSEAFAHCINLVSVTLGNNVTSIGTYAFASGGIKSITIPNSVTNIDNYAFSVPTILYGYKTCTAFVRYTSKHKNEYVYLDGVDKDNIIEGEIGNCTWSLDKLTGELVINGSGKMTDFMIQGAPWYQHKWLITEIKVSDGITSIGDFAFWMCGSIKNVTIPNSVISIGNNAFSDCTSLVNVTIPNSVISIGDGAFSNCTSLVNVTIGNSLNRIGVSMFFNCISLKEVTIPQSVTIIDAGAFHGCRSLSSVTMGNNVKRIDRWSFHGCSSLENITIPYKVDEIHSDAFRECTNLKKVYVCNKNCNIQYDCGFNSNNTIYGFVGSTAENLAEEIGAEFIDIMTLHNHTIIPVESKEANCTETGLTSGKKCSVCDTFTVPQKEIPAKGHSYNNGVVIKAATCKAKGVKTYTCSRCKNTKNVTIAKKDHNYKTSTTKATLKKDGKIISKCTVCGDVGKTTKIHPVKTVKLSTIKYTYNGKTKKPAVKIYDSNGNKLKYGTDYTYSRPKSSKKIGKYTIKVTFKSKYSGTKNLYYEITPEGTSVSKLTAAKKRLNVTIKKQTLQTSGYQVKYSTSKKFTNAKTKTVKGNKTTSYTIKSLKSRKTYYVRVRTYKTVNGKKFYSAWSKIVKKKTK